MKRFDTICNLGDQSLVDYEIPDVEFGESITDDSFFVPTAEALKTASGVLSEDEVRRYYDFPDGKDTGIVVPLARKKGVDIAELSTDVRRQQDEIVSVVNKAKKEAEFKKDLERRYGNSVEKTAEQSVVE
mgnify:CR=1 FL=1